MSEFGKRPLAAIGYALSASLLASWLATASLAAATDTPAAGRDCAEVRAPSNFDYLVLAGIADSPQLHAMASFRSTASQRGESKSRDEDAVEHTINKRVSQCRL